MRYLTDSESWFWEFTKESRCAVARKDQPWVDDELQCIEREKELERYVDDCIRRCEQAEAERAHEADDIDELVAETEEAAPQQPEAIADRVSALVAFSSIAHEVEIGSELVFAVVAASCSLNARPLASWHPRENVWSGLTLTSWHRTSLPNKELRMPWIAVVSPSKSVRCLDVLQSLLPERIQKRRPLRSATYVDRLNHRVQFPCYEDDSDEEDSAPRTTNVNLEEKPWYWVRTQGAKRPVQFVVPPFPPVGGAAQIAQLLQCFSGVVVLTKRPDSIESLRLADNPELRDRILTINTNNKNALLGGPTAWRADLRAFTTKALPTERKVLDATPPHLRYKSWWYVIPAIYCGRSYEMYM